MLEKQNEKIVLHSVTGCGALTLLGTPYIIYLEFDNFIEANHSKNRESAFFLFLSEAFLHWLCSLHDYAHNYAHGFV